jgi:putative nucleotidyltransferase-like protein
MLAGVTPLDHRTESRLAGLPQSFRLACACAVWPPSQSSDAAVRALADGVDWAGFMRVLARQRVVGQAHAALARAGVTAPQPFAERLAQGAAGVARRNLALGAESLRLRRRLEAEGIGVLFIKGATLSQLAYGGQTLKHGRDIDLLVAPEDAERAFELLLADGYVNIAPAGKLSAEDRQALFRLHKDVELARPAAKGSLELHWRLVDNPELLKGIDARNPSQEVALLNGRLPTLADPELFAYLCVHGATHSWFRLKWLADLSAWLAPKSEGEIVAYYQRAQDLGVEACAAQALVLRGALLGAPAPPALAPRLARANVRFMVGAAIDAMAGGGGADPAARPFGMLRLAPAGFLRGRGLAVFVAQCRLLFLDSLEDRLELRLPRPLHILYPILRAPLWIGRVLRRRSAAKAADAGA